MQELHMPEARLHCKQLEKAAPDGIAPRKTHDIPLVLPLVTVRVSDSDTIEE
jgi:hypothetical protein